MKRRFLILLSFLFFLSASAQYAFYNEKYVEGKFTFELMADAGVMNCLTDLGGKKGAGKPFIKDLNIAQTRASYGLAGTLNYKRTFSLSFQFVRGMVSAGDGILKNAGSSARGRYLRGLDFYSPIHELSTRLEFSPLMLLAAEGDWLPGINWYIFAGVGTFRFNPQTRYGAQNIQLSKLHTEGQGFEEFPERIPYGLNQFNIPLGTGAKLELFSTVNLRLELNYRKLFTDYLDDVSTGYINPALFTKYMAPSEALMAAILADRRPNPGTKEEIRGNSRNKDSFFSLSLMISFVFGRHKTP